MLKKVAQLLLLVASGILLYFNWTSWHSLIVGVLGLVLYYGVNTITWGDVVARVLPLNRAWARMFGFLVSFYLSAMAVGIPVVLWKYDRLAVAGAMLAVGVVGLILSLGGASLYRPSPQPSPNGRGGHKSPLLSEEGVGGGAVAFKNWHFILLIALGILFVSQIWSGRTGMYIFSPWDVLSSFTLMLFFVITFLVGLLIFSNHSAKVVLVVIIAFSYLTHLYLPVVYETGFGGDKWRHLGAEKWLQEGQIYTPSVWGEERRSVVNFGALGVPEALVAGNKTSYSAQWAATIMLAESLGVDVFWVDLLLVFLLWSLFLPLILYQFGKLIFVEGGEGEERGVKGSEGGVEGGRLGLLLAFLPTLFYTFQSEGAITIPVSFGHLFFFFVLLLWVYYVKEGKRDTLVAAGALSLFFYWGYILNFFVLLGTGILAMVWRSRKRLLFITLAALSVFAIPLLEIWQGLSTVSEDAFTWRTLVNALADAMGRLLAYIGIIVPPDFIDQGNFLYNQSGQSLSRLPLFSYQLVPFIVSTLVWAFILWGIYKVIRNKKTRHTHPHILTSSSPIVFLIVIFFIALASYFISFSFTTGVHILARRLNETIVFFMILFLGWGIIKSPLLSEEGVGGGVVGLLSRSPISKKILALCFVLAFAATSTYASGPKLQLVTADELKAAELIWSELKDKEPPYCVIANTWPLLGLEAVSARRVTAGGFPLYNEYAQPERVKIFEMMSKKPSQVWLEGAFRITGADSCYYMTEKRWMSDFVFADTVKLLGEPRRIGTVYIWRVENQRTVVAIDK